MKWLRMGITSYGLTGSNQYAPISWTWNMCHGDYILLRQANLTFGTNQINPTVAQSRADVFAHYTYPNRGTLTQAPADTLITSSLIWKIKCVQDNADLNNTPHLEISLAGQSEHPYSDAAYRHNIRCVIDNDMTIRSNFWENIDYHLQNLSGVDYGVYYLPMAFFIGMDPTPPSGGSPWPTGLIKQTPMLEVKKNIGINVQSSDIMDCPWLNNPSYISSLNSSRWWGSGVIGDTDAKNYLITQENWLQTGLTTNYKNCPSAFYRNLGPWAGPINAIDADMGGRNYENSSILTIVSGASDDFIPSDTLFDHNLSGWWYPNSPWTNSDNNNFLNINIKPGKIPSTQLRASAATWFQILDYNTTRRMAALYTDQVTDVIKNFSDFDTSPVFTYFAASKFWEMYGLINNVFNISNTYLFDFMCGGSLNMYNTVIHGPSNITTPSVSSQNVDIVYNQVFSGGTVGIRCVTMQGEQNVNMNNAQRIIPTTPSADIIDCYIVPSLTCPFPALDIYGCRKKTTGNKSNAFRYKLNTGLNKSYYADNTSVLILSTTKE